MYIFVIFSSLLCLQLISTVVSDTNDADQLESPTLVNTASDEDYDYVPRSTSFLRFGRQLTPSSGSFLRFGRSPSNFLRFGRSNPNAGNFLRFGRETPSTNFLRFGRKGEFLRFG